MTSIGGEKKLEEEPWNLVLLLFLLLPPPPSTDARAKSLTQWKWRETPAKKNQCALKLPRWFEIILWVHQEKFWAFALLYRRELFLLALQKKIFALNVRCCMQRRRERKRRRGNEKGLLDLVRDSTTSELGTEISYVEETRKRWIVTVLAFAWYILFLPMQNKKNCGMRQEKG